MPAHLQRKENLKGLGQKKDTGGTMLEQQMADMMNRESSKSVSFSISGH